MTDGPRTTPPSPGGEQPALHRYPIEVLHLLVSPGHNYAGRPQDGAGRHPTEDLDEVRLVAGKGIVGDRYFGRAAHRDAAVTLIAAEALEDAAAVLGLAQPLDPVPARRNVVVRGVDLNALRGETFVIRSLAAGAPDGAAVTLLGGRPANPCAWMDRVYAPGAQAALRGRGGLRCRVLTDGLLRHGPAVLETAATPDPDPAHDRIS